MHTGEGQRLSGDLLHSVFQSVTLPSPRASLPSQAHGVHLVYEYSSLPNRWLKRETVTSGMLQPKGCPKAPLATGDKTTALLTIIKVGGQPLGAHPEIGSL